MAEIRVNTTGTLKLFDADDSHSAGIAAGTITADATLMTLNTADIDISVPIDVTGASTITTADNSDTLTLTSTDADASVGPALRLYRNSASPADDDELAKIRFDGKNSAGEDVTYGYIQVQPADVTDGTEDGFMQLQTMVGGTSRGRVSMYSYATVMNEHSQDIDFRVEGNLSEGLIHVDGSMDNVSIVGSEKNAAVAATAASQVFAQGSSSVFRIVGHNAEGSCAVIHASSTTNTVQPTLNLSKSANAAIGSYTGVAHNENIGQILFTADDGTDLVTPAGYIGCTVDAATGSNDMPGRLEFATTKNGASSPTLRMYIYNHGNTQFVPGDNNRGYVFDGSVDSLYPTANDTSDLGYSNLKWDDVYATNGTIQTSDRTIKDNITESDLGLDFVNKLKPVSYKFKDKTRTHYGLISQDVEDLLGELSKTGTDFAGFIKTQKEDNSKWTKDDAETQDAVLFTSDDDEVKKGIKSVGDIKQKASKEIGQFKHEPGTKKIDNEYSYALRYEEFISPMIKAIQELATKVKALEEA